MVRSEHPRLPSALWAFLKDLSLLEEGEAVLMPKKLLEGPGLLLVCSVTCCSADDLRVLPAKTCAARSIFSRLERKFLSSVDDRRGKKRQC